QLERPPVRDLGDEDRTVLVDADLVSVEMPSRRRELETPEYLSVPIDFENLAGDGITLVDQMIRGPKKAERVANGLPFAHEAAVCIEDLDPLVVAVSHIDPISVNGDRVGQIELAWPAALHAPAADQDAGFVEFQHPRVSVAVGDVDVAGVVECHIGRLVEMARVISRYSHAAEGEQDPSLRIALQDH